MQRRGFLKMLGLAPVAVAAAPLLAKLPVSPAAIIVSNQDPYPYLTAEMVRNAVKKLREADQRARDQSGRNYRLEAYYARG